MSEINNTRRKVLKTTLIAASILPSLSFAHTKDKSEQAKLVAPALKKGDTIGFFSPSTPATSFAIKRFERAKRFLNAQGYKLKSGSLTAKSDHYRSGSIKDRVDELNALIRDPNVRCIMSTMGGMVSNSMLPYIDYDALKKDPKIIIGYSDVTAILFGIYAKTGLITYYGPALVSSFGEMGYFLEETYTYFKDIVETPKLPYRIENPQYWTEDYIDWQKQSQEKSKTANKLITLNPGKVTGRLIAGNLNTISGIFGSPYMPIINKGDILLIEDSFTDAADIERSFSHLLISGVFDLIGGLILGKHEKFDDRGTKQMPYDIMMEVIREPQFPILAQYDCSHTHPMITLPIGSIATLDATAQSLTIEHI
jgi:muramoyltetrapeptide carboxypeptidase LdcA involved in peptidoglycan recycling